MRPFNQSESGYTATAKFVTFGVDTQDYDPEILDNPLRKKVNAALIHANRFAYKTRRGCL